MLPPARYQRVQLASAGLIGLTQDGELVGAVPPVVQELPPTGAFNATNMWGRSAVCPVAQDGSFRIVSDVPEESVEEPLEPRLMEGHFAQAFCVFEGLAVGVLSNGSLWTNFEPTPAGSDWTEVAMSLGIFCSIAQSGAVVCHEPYWGCDRVSANECIVAEPPVFPPGRYHSIAATSSVACALDEQGALVCRRFDGVELSVAAGPHSFIEAGREVLCAVRADGSVACFRHGGDLWPNEVEAFERIEPIDDVDW